MAVSMRAAKGARLGSRTSCMRSVRPARGAMVCQAQRTHWGGAAAAAAAAAASLIVGSAGALTFNELQSLTYTQVKGSGIAGSCPVIESGSSNLRDLKGGNYTLEKFCLEPTKFQVKEEGSRGEEFVDTKLLTRLTYALDEISASFKVGGDGSVDLKEIDGIDYAAVTVQLPGGERVPFLFSMKELAAKGNLENFSGEFTVPSYRGTTFLDPKGRGASTGYDASLALPARADDEELLKENIKSAASGKGTAAFSVAKVDPVTGEVAGVFESIQPSDTDLGSKNPKDVKIVGIWYGQLK